MSRLYLIGVALLAALILNTTFKAWAHNPDTHQPDDLSKAVSERYGICCSGDDYVRIETWEPTDTGWRIMFKGHWMDVERQARVSNMHNPDGEAKAWINGTPGALYVRCFMEGASG